MKKGRSGRSGRKVSRRVNREKLSEIASLTGAVGMFGYIMFLFCYRLLYFNVAGESQSIFDMIMQLFS